MGYYRRVAFVIFRWFSCDFSVYIYRTVLFRVFMFLWSLLLMNISFYKLIN